MTFLAFALTFLVGAAEGGWRFLKSCGKPGRRLLFASPPLLLPLIALSLFTALGAFPSPSLLANCSVAFSLLCLLFLGGKASLALSGAEKRGEGAPGALSKREVKKIAEKYSIPRSFSRPAFFGFREEADASRGEADPNFAFAASYPYWKLAKEGRIVGEPGAGLSSAPFSASLSMAGAKGEKLLAKFFALFCPGVRVYASLYGLKKGMKTPSDIDLVLAGVDGEGRVRMWMVDAKNYRGGQRVVYDRPAPGVLVRVDAERRAFLAGSGAGPALKMGGNMGRQKEEWERALSRLAGGRWEIFDAWRVCIISASGGGQPKVAPGVEWPGGIKARTPYQICREVAKAGPLSPNIPPSLHAFLSSMLKS